VYVGIVVFYILLFLAYHLKDTFCVTYSLFPRSECDKFEINFNAFLLKVPGKVSFSSILVVHVNILQGILKLTHLFHFFFM
jgi:hypothetical protein